MPKLNGLFESFDNLDQIDITALSSWLKSPPDAIKLENYLANRILYPQLLPVTDFDMKIDLAILREALKIAGPKPGQKSNLLLGDNPFLNITLRKIIIPEKFLFFIPNLVSLTWAFVDGLLLGRQKTDFYSDLWTVVIADGRDETVGSIMLPQFAGEDDTMNLSLLGKEVRIKAGSLTIVACPKDRCEIAYKFDRGKILGKREAALEVYGGRLGLMIDGRIG